MLILVWASYIVPLVLDNRVCIYRDAGHYYFPWWYRLGRLRLATGRWVPLWEPAEDLGRHWAADPTTAVYYPFTALASAPIDPAFSYAVYLGLHYALATLFAYWVLRCWQIRCAAAVGAAVGYAFGGYLVAQHANLPYLVSGTWLPLALCPIGRTLLCRYTGRNVQQASGRSIGRMRWFRSLLALKHGQLDELCQWLIGAMALALMVLGGDPQTAYHVVLIGITCAWPPARMRWSQRFRYMLGRLFGWALWCCAAMILCLPQILHSLHQLPNSLRSRAVHAENVRAVSGERGAGEYNPVTNGSPNATEVAQDEQSNRWVHDPYGFSCPPWRIAEWFWPNICGKTYPIVHRWTRALGEQQTWFPSLYQGTLAAVGILAVGPLLRGSALTRWVLGVWLLSVLAAAGHYGPANLLNGTLGTHLPGYLGGVTWLLVNLAPGYHWFRYPSKWMVLASWCAAYLAAAGWSHIEGKDGERIKQRLIQVSLASLVLLLAAFFLTWIFRGQWRQWLVPYRDLAFGPIDPDGACTDLLLSLAQTALVSIIAWGLVARWLIRMDRPALATVLLIGLHGADLIFAHQWQWISAPAEELRQSGVDRRIILAHQPDNTSQPPARTAPAMRPAIPVALWRIERESRPARWAQSSSPERMVEILRWERDTLYPKHFLMLDVPITLIPSSSSDLRADWAAWMAHGNHHPNVPSVEWRNSRVPIDGYVVPWLGVKPASEPHLGLTGSRAERLSEFAQFIALDRRHPAVRLERNVQLVTLGSRNVRWWPSWWRAPTPRYAAGTPESEDQMAIEWPYLGIDISRFIGDRIHSSPVERSIDRWTVLTWAPQEIALELELDSPAWIIVRVSYDSWWQAKLVAVDSTGGLLDSSGIDLPVARAEGLLLAVPVPGGYWRLQLTFQMPYESFWLSCTVVAWVMAAGLALWTQYRARCACCCTSRIRFWLRELRIVRLLVRIAPLKALYGSHCVMPNKHKCSPLAAGWGT